MFLSKLYLLVPEERRDCFIIGLSVGLFIGLLVGLLAGLFVGLLVGLLASLSAGLFVGLLVGLFEGLAVSLLVGLFVGLLEGLLASLSAGLFVGLLELSQSLSNLVFILFFIIVISEVLFWFDKHRWKNFGRWENTVLKKSECFLEVGLVVVNIRNVIVHYNDFISFFETQQEMIHMFLIFVGYGTIIALIAVGWFWLNSLKYKNKED